MKVYALIGKSGTGKSFQAVNLCKELDIESIIDDGLFICRNKVIAGISAKRQKTKVGAVKTALFHEPSHMEDVKNAIREQKPKSILIIGTSDGMVNKIVARLDMPRIDRRIYINEITTEAERAIARRQRDEMGEHAIPAPTFQLKRQFSGYFMLPMKMILREWGSLREVSEKSVVRPTYSYRGGYEISDKVMVDIIECVKNETDYVSEIGRVAISPIHEGIDIYVTADFKYGVNLPSAAKEFQQEIVNKIEEMTAFNVNRLDLEIKDLA